MTKIELENVKPAQIEARSFEIITEELGNFPLLPGTEPIVKRCIQLLHIHIWAGRGLTKRSFLSTEDLCIVLWLMRTWP